MKTLSNWSKNEFEDILVYFSTSIFGSSSEDEILWEIAKNCIAKLGFQDCVVYLVDERTNMLVQKAAYGPKNPVDYEIHQPIEIPVGQGITGTVALTGVAEIVSNTAEDPRYIVDDEARLSEIAVPIFTEEKVIGVIDCENPTPNYFTEQHLRILNAIAAISGIKIGQLRADRKIAEEQQKLFEVTQKMTALKIKALNAQLNPHFMFNALNAIQFFITSNHKKTALTYLSLFSKLIRYYLTHIEDEEISLDEEVSMLECYLELQKLRYVERLDYLITVNPKKDITGAKIPAFIVQTLAENIIEHTITTHYRQSRINILFNVREAHVELQVEIHNKGMTKTENEYLPEYREGMARWEDHVDVLNELKGYQIEKNIEHWHLEKEDISGNLIRVVLPSLR